MIKHIVCFKLADPTPANCQKAAEVLRSMDGNVPLLRGIEVGVDELRSGRSYDVILQVLLDDMAALDAYQQDSVPLRRGQETHARRGRKQHCHGLHGGIKTKLLLRQIVTMGLSAIFLPFLSWK